MRVDLPQAERVFEALPAALRAPTLSPAYVAADAANEPGAEPLFLVHQTAQGVYYHPLLLAPIEGTDLWDLRSCYGYGGPVSSTDDAAFLAEASARRAAWCVERRVLVEFVRFHPLLENWRGYDGEVMFNRETVALDSSVEDPSTGYRTRARTTLRKAWSGGLTVRWSAEWRDMERFRRIYLAEMARLGAGDPYLFSEAYFAAMHHWAGARLALCERAGALVGGALFLFGGETAEYHLSALNDLGRAWGGANLLLHEGALMSRRLGLRWLHLGGGNDPSPDNSLLFFKSGFSRARWRFMLGKRVYLRERYAALKRSAEARLGRRCERVLFYRQ